MARNRYLMAISSSGAKYSQVPLWRNPIYRDFSHGTTRAVAEPWLDLKLTAHTPYLDLTGELWGVWSEEIGENWPR